MFLLKKLITYFVLLPPGNLVFFLTLLAFYLKFLKRRWAFRLTLSVAALLYLLSIKPVAVALIYPLEHQYGVPPAAERQRCDVLVVLGGGVKKGAPFLDLKNDLKEDAFERATGALKLFEEKSRPIIASGYSRNDKLSEAKVAADYLHYMGVPRNYLIEEGKSADTEQNALFTSKLIKERGFKRVCLITSAYHMPRAVMLFERVGVKNVIPVPVNFKSSSPFPLTVYDFLPTSYWLDVSAKALHEYFGLVYYLVKR